MSVDYTNKNFNWNHFFECLQYRFSKTWDESIEEKYGNIDSLITQKGLRHVVDVLLDLEGYPPEKYMSMYESLEDTLKEED